MLLLQCVYLFKLLLLFWINTQEWNCWVIWCSIFSFLRSLHTVLEYSSTQGFSSLHILASVSFLFFLKLAVLTGVKWYLIVGFDLHFPDDEWCWASFHVPVAHLCVFLEKCLFRFSVHFMIRLFFWCWVKWICIYFVY